jgi:hypothetical protein
VNDDYCDRQLKPIEQEWCTANISCLTWFIGEWSSVDRKILKFELFLDFVVLSDMRSWFSTT